MKRGFSIEYIVQKTLLINLKHVNFRREHYESAWNIFLGVGWVLLARRYSMLFKF